MLSFGGYLPKKADGGEGGIRTLGPSFLGQLLSSE